MGEVPVIVLRKANVLDQKELDDHFEENEDSQFLYHYRWRLHGVLHRTDGPARIDIHPHRPDFVLYQYVLFGEPVEPAMFDAIVTKRDNLVELAAEFVKVHMEERHRGTWTGRSVRVWRPDSMKIALEIMKFVLAAEGHDPEFVDSLSLLRGFKR